MLCLKFKKNLKPLNWNENWNETRTRTRLKVLIKMQNWKKKKKYY